MGEGDDDGVTSILPIVSSASDRNKALMLGFSTQHGRCQLAWDEVSFKEVSTREMDEIGAPHPCILNIWEL